jgi:tetrahydromethanopterin S-methyltransferase subunit G
MTMEQKICDENVFVKIEEYKDVIDAVDMIKNKISDAKASIGKINDLKNQEDAELDMWKASIDDIERRVHFIDNELFEC